VVNWTTGQACFYFFVHKVGEVRVFEARVLSSEARVHTSVILAQRLHSKVGAGNQFRIDRFSSFNLANGFFVLVFSVRCR
jgi:hypothetical protein